LLKLRADIGFVYDLAKANPSGFAWAWNLICAEIARIFGKVEKAFNYYRLARSKAKDSGYLLPLAFVQECLGRFSFEQHDEVLAAQQLRDACQFYSMWGSEAKASQLSREFFKLSSLKGERKVISTMRIYESAQDVISKLGINSLGSNSRLQSDSSHLSAVIDQIMQKSSGRDSASSGITALIDEYIEDARSNARIDFDKEMADSFRRGVLLNGTEQIPGFDIELFYQGAQHVGGDFFGYHFDSKSGNLYLQIGDVSAIGASAVLVSTAVSSALATEYHSLLASVEMSADEIVCQLAKTANAAVVRFGQPLNCSMRMAFVVLNIKSGQGSFLNAAHMPVYIKNNGEVRSLMQRGSHLGEIGFVEQCLVSRFQVNPGDSLFLYTDGLVKNKSLSGQSLSPRNIRKIIGESQDSHSMYQNILAAYKDITANNSVIDDCVFLTVGRHA
jgi:serine phosphatase RsbU (regulator of sigma subunit)